MQQPSHLIKNTNIHFGFMPDAVEINQKIMAAYVQLRTEDILKRSHYFGGRYENLYLERELIPEISSVLTQAEVYTKDILTRQNQPLRSGFWINDMGPNEVTTEHDHDDYDEMLSGVYYVQVPKNSGELVIIEKHSRTLVTPQAGMFVFFAPDVKHAVSENLSGERRISIGMNSGPMET
jgi:hypothetical protein